MAEKDLIEMTKRNPALVGGSKRFTSALRDVIGQSENSVTLSTEGIVIQYKDPKRGCIVIDIDELDSVRCVKVKVCRSKKPSESISLHCQIHRVSLKSPKATFVSFLTGIEKLSTYFLRLSMLEEDIVREDTRLCHIETKGFLREKQIKSV